MSELAEYWNYIEAIETPEQYACFQTFRDAGPRRKIALVSQVHGYSDAQLYNWARQCSWHDRCATYDIERNKVRDVLLAERRAQTDAAWAERRAMLFGGLEEVAELGIDKLLQKMRSNRADLRPGELRLIVETLTKWQNLANGDATEKVDFGLDYSKLTDEQIDKLEEAARLQELAKITK